MKQFSAQDYKNYFEKIDANQFCVGERTNALGQHCAYGFLDPKQPSMDTKAWDFYIGLQEIENRTGIDIAGVNNGRDKRFPGNTPKERILKMLDSIIAMDELENWNPDEEDDEFMEEELEPAYIK